MDHAVVADVLDLDARRHELSRIGIAFVPHRIEFGGMDNGGGKPGKFGGAKRRNPGIGEVGTRRQIVGEVGFQRGPVEQMVFGERLARRRGFLEIEHRADQALRRYRRARRFAARPGTPRRRALRRRNRRQPRALPHRCRARRPCSDTHRVAAIASSMAAGKFVLGRKPVVHGNKAAAGGLRERRADHGHGSRCCRRPCRRRGKTQSPANLRLRHWREHKDGKEYRRRGPAIRRRSPVAAATSARANCISFASAWRRSSAVGRDRSAGEAAAIIARKRFARGSRGISAPVKEM